MKTMLTLFNDYLRDIEKAVPTLDGDDLDNIINGTVNDDDLLGKGGNDSLFGLEGDDFISGGDGDDFMEGGAGADTLDGGGGIDTVDYNGPAGVVVRIGGFGQGGDAAGDFIESSIENIRGTGLFGDQLTGSVFDNELSGFGGADRLVGLAGDDDLFGGVGNDVLLGGDGGDLLDGGDGVDTADYRQASDGNGVLINLDTGQAVSGDANGDVLVSIENVTGTNVADIITGNAGTNALKGLGGNDILDGAGGADTLNGGAGVDTASYQFAGAIAVDLATGKGTVGNAQGDVLVSIENVDGGQGGDTITGNGAANVIRGFAGNDFLQGAGGADTLDGGIGTDTLTFAFVDNASGVKVDFAAGTGNGGNAEGDSYAKIENVIGTEFADTLIGDGAVNVLTGGLGKDGLTGGVGADRFNFASVLESPAGAGRDVITDFSRAQGDKINLTSIDADEGAGGNQAFAFIGGSKFSGTAGELRFANEVVSGDVDGDSTADFQTQLTGAQTVFADDFLL
jgi:Ca2+-binding RTX toxin-like protein